LQCKRAPFMGNILCVELVFENNEDDHIRRLRQSQRIEQQKYKRIGPHNSESKYSLIPSIVEEVVLEDMCELANIEYENDPEFMSKNDKMSMMKKFRDTEETQKHFASERAFSNFIQKNIQHNALTPHQIQDQVGRGFGGTQSYMIQSKSRRRQTMQSTTRSIHDVTKNTGSLFSVTGALDESRMVKQQESYVMGYQVARGSENKKQGGMLCCKPGRRFDTDKFTKGVKKKRRKKDRQRKTATKNAEPYW